jgi:hypothetical protein
MVMANLTGPFLRLGHDVRTLRTASHGGSYTKNGRRNSYFTVAIIVHAYVRDIFFSVHTVSTRLIEKRKGAAVVDDDQVDGGSLALQCFVAVD